MWYACVVSLFGVLFIGVALCKWVVSLLFRCLCVCLCVCLFVLMVVCCCCARVCLWFSVCPLMCVACMFRIVVVFALFVPIRLFICWCDCVLVVVRWFVDLLVRLCV